MTVKAILKTDSKNPKAVAKALNADNNAFEGLTVETTANEQVVTKIEAGNLSTVLSTIDDLIACQQAAEKVIC